MSINLELAIKHMYDLRAKKVTYSMTGSRTGADGTADCSGAIYASLVKGGGPTLTYPFSTESEHDYLLKNGFELIAFNKSWNMQRGDIGVLGIKGQSAFAGGHTFMAVDGTNVIHCNYDNNGVTVNNENTMPYSMGFYIYRQKDTGKPIDPGTPKPPNITNYHTSGKRFKAKDPLVIHAKSDWAVLTGGVIEKGREFDIKEIVNNGTSTHAVLQNGNEVVTLHKSYVDKIK